MPVGGQRFVTFRGAQSWLERNPELADNGGVQREELGLVMYMRYSDSRSGDVEYELTNVRRADPPADLFVVPTDYTLGTCPLEDPCYSSMPPELYKR